MRQASSGQRLCISHSIPTLTGGEPLDGLGVKCFGMQGVGAWHLVKLGASTPLPLRHPGHQRHDHGSIRGIIGWHSSVVEYHFQPHYAALWIGWIIEFDFLPALSGVSILALHLGTLGCLCRYISFARYCFSTAREPLNSTLSVFRLVFVVVHLVCQDPSSQKLGGIGFKVAKLGRFARSFPLISRWQKWLSCSAGS